MIFLAGREKSKDNQEERFDRALKHFSVQNADLANESRFGQSGLAKSTSH